MKYHHTLLDTLQTGINRVKQGFLIAFIWGSIVLEHTTHTVKWGTLKTTGNLFGKMGYGIGLPKDSPYTKQPSQAILELGHEGHMGCLE